MSMTPRVAFAVLFQNEKPTHKKKHGLAVFGFSIDFTGCAMDASENIEVSKCHQQQKNRFPY